MNVALDASVLGFMLVRDPKPGQERTSAIVQRVMRDEEHELFIPTPALAETLAWLRADLRDAVLRQLQAAQSVHIVPFDLGAARIAADLGNPRVRNRTRQKVKVDVQIIATAIRWSCDSVCSVDKGFESIARKRIDVVKPNDLVAQLPLAPPDAPRAD